LTTRRPTLQADLGVASTRRFPPGLRRLKVESVEIDSGAGLNVYEVDNLHFKTSGNRKENVERQVSLGSLTLGEISKGQPNSVGCIGLRPAETPAGLLDADCNPLSEYRGAHPRDKTPSCF